MTTEDGGSDPAPITPAEIAPAVLAVPGVVRLEPRLTDLASRLRRRITDLLADDAADPDSVGVEFSHAAEHQLTVVVDVATDGRRPALEVADEVRHTTRHLLTDAGQACRVVVNVLAIEDEGS